MRMLIPANVSRGLACRGGPGGHLWEGHHSRIFDQQRAESSKPRVGLTEWFGKCHISRCFGGLPVSPVIWYVPSR